jgi:hypothetical protein
VDIGTGEVVIDMALNSTGDLAIVVGIDRLMQMILIWLLTPLGQVIWEPNFGNPYFAQLGRPVGQSTQQLFLDMLSSCERAFLINQDQAAQAGSLTADEMVDHFQDELVTIVGPGIINVSFTVVARSGAVKEAVVPFATNLAAGQAISVAQPPRNF